MNKYTKNKQYKTNNNNALGSNNPWKESKLDDLANQIDEINRRRLPDGVMGNILTGKEAEVRQDAALMLLQGFLSGNLDFVNAAARNDQDATTYHLERVASMARCICKLRLQRKLAKEQNRQVEFSEHNAGSCMHPAYQNFWDLPQAIWTEMGKASVSLGVSTGEISVGNAKIVNMLIDNTPVQAIADSRKVTRGAIYQRLDLVRQVLPKLIAKIEVPTP